MSPVMTCIFEVQWEALKRLICSGKRVLWITEGALASAVTQPDNALVQGLFRTVRRERPDSELTILDLESATAPIMNRTLGKVLRQLLSDPDTDTEYAERDGVVLIERIIPNADANNFKAIHSGRESATVVKNLYNAKARVQLRAEKIGILESLTWCETDPDETLLSSGMAEIEVMAVGVNFKASLCTNCFLGRGSLAKHPKNITVPR